MTIERPIRDVPVDAGQRSVEEILVKNQTARAVRITVAPRDLATRSAGAQSLAIAPTGSEPRGAGDWLDVRQDEVRIESYEQAILGVGVEVPRDAGAGAWAGAVLLTVSGVGAQSTVSLQQETSVAFLFTVRGAFERDLQVSVRPDAELRWRGGKSVWKVTIANEGDAFESFGGRLRIDAGIGGTRSFRLDSGILFPGERRTQEIEADLRPAPDRIVGELDVTTRGRTGTQDASQDLELRATSAAVLVIPWWLPIVLLVAIVVIVLRLRARARRRADDVVVEQYEYDA